MTLTHGLKQLTVTDMATTAAAKEERCHEDYHKYFDTNAYLGEYFAFAVDEHPFFSFALSSLHSIYSEGKVSGKRLVDIGSGPTIHTLIPAAKWFEEIYISDYCPRNTESVQKWLARDTEAYDWQNYFQFFAEKDGDKDAWQRYEDVLRARIKSTMFCDYHQPNPLQNESLGQFDAVTMSNALFSGNKDIAEYRQSLKNVVSLLKPGGFFVDVTLLNCPFYVVGGEKFTCVSVTLDEALTALEDAGVDVIQKYYDDKIIMDMEEYSKLSGALVILGKKNRFQK